MTEPKTDKAHAAEAKAEAKAEKEAGKTSPMPLAATRGVFAVVRDLTAALRAKDWDMAMTLFIDLLNILKGDLGNVPTLAVVYPAGVAYAPTVDGADSLASALEAFANAHEPKAASFTFGPGPHPPVSAAPRAAFPWQEFVPLLRLLFDAILNRK